MGSTTGRPEPVVDSSAPGLLRQRGSQAGLQVRHHGRLCSHLRPAGDDPCNEGGYRWAWPAGTHGRTCWGWKLSHHAPLRSWQLGGENEVQGGGKQDGKESALTRRFVFLPFCNSVTPTINPVILIRVTGEPDIRYSIYRIAGSSLGTWTGEPYIRCNLSFKP